MWCCSQGPRCWGYSSSALSQKANIPPFADRPPKVLKHAQHGGEGAGAIHQPSATVAGKHNTAATGPAPIGRVFIMGVPQVGTRSLRQKLAATSYLAMRFGYILL